MRKFLVIAFLAIAATHAQAQTEDINRPNTKEFESPLDSIRRLYKKHEIDASFKGGDVNTFARWVVKRAMYPRSVMRQNIGGKVIVRFIVNTKGKVSDIDIIESPHHLLSEEVYQIVRRSPRWRPARGGLVRRVDGVAVEKLKFVNQYIEVPVNFTLGGK